MRVLSRQEFLGTPAGAQAQRDLHNMVSSAYYDTGGTCDPKKGVGLVFVKRHMDYLMKHPQVSPKAYLSNLRVMTKAHR